MMTDQSDHWAEGGFFPIFKYGNKLCLSGNKTHSLNNTLLPATEEKGFGKLSCHLPKWEKQALSQG